MKKEGVGLKLILVLILIIELFSVFSIPAIRNSFIERKTLLSPGELLSEVYLGKETSGISEIECTPKLEICDTLDNDCDFLIDENDVCITDVRIFYPDGSSKIYSKTDKP